MSSCGLAYVMILGFSVSGSTAAVHTGDTGLNPTKKAKNLFNNLVMRIVIVKVMNTKLWDVNQLMSYRDAHWYIKDTWIGFSARNIAKQAVVCHTLWLLGFWVAWNGEIVAYNSQVA